MNTVHAHSVLRGLWVLTFNKYFEELDKEVLKKIWKFAVKSTIFSASLILKILILS